MEAHRSKACWRAGAKLVVGFAVLGAVIGIRIVTAKPMGIEAELAELERFEAEQAAAAAAESAPAASASAGGRLDGASDSTGRGSDRADLDRMVRCHLAGQTQFMRAADCGTRGGALEELPPPEPEDPTATGAAP